MKNLGYVWLSLLLLISADAWSQTTFTVMEYNCENAFDTIHDEGKNDYEYCPEGERKWSNWKLNKKLKSISKVIAAADEERPADLVALCEVENDTVLTRLTQHTPLASLDYKYIMTSSDDARGVDVALLYSPFTFHLIDTQHIKPHLPEHPTRDILHVSGTIASGDTLDVYVVHLPSKLGGSEALARSMKVTNLLKESIDSINAIRRTPNIIVAGDFNAEPKSPQLKLLTTSTPLKDSTSAVSPGTYKYQGDWSVIDHILYHTTTLSLTSSRALTLPFLLENDNTHGGKKPHRTYLGPIYKGGTSDHLPIVATFKLQSK